MWAGADGNFFGSTLVALNAEDPPAASLSLAAGLALIEAVDAAAPGQPLMLKWPNDLLLSGRKLAGTLLERNGERVVVGFGVNLTRAPKLPDRAAASLSGVIGAQAFAPVLAGSFARLLALWRGANPDAFAQAWLARAHPLGTKLTVHVGHTETLSGRFGGIERDGALRLMLDDGGIELVRAGDVAL